MCKRRTISKRLKRQRKKGGRLPVDMVKLAKIAISPVPGRGLAELKGLLHYTAGHRRNVFDR
jgi:hypothetical protein